MWQFNLKLPEMEKKINISFDILFPGLIALTFKKLFLSSNLNMFDVTFKALLLCLIKGPLQDLYILTRIVIPCYQLPSSFILFLTYKCLSISSVLEDTESLQVCCIPPLLQFLLTCNSLNNNSLDRMPYLEARSIP